MSALIPNGVHFGLAEATYRADPAYSYSQIKRMLPTAADYKWNKDHPEPPSAALGMGVLIGRIVLEPERFALDGFALKPEPKAPNGWRAEQERLGLMVITESEIEDATLCAESLRNHPEAGPLLTGDGRSEVSLFGTVCGVRVKARVDRVPDELPYLLDLKTTRDAEPGKWITGKNDETYWVQSRFAKQAEELLYWTQAGLYLHLWNQLAPESPRHRWLNVAVESFGPFKPKVFEYEQAAISDGFDEFTRLLGKLLECEKTGVYPGYPLGAEIIGRQRR